MSRIDNNPDCTINKYIKSCIDSGKPTTVPDVINGLKKLKCYVTERIVRNRLERLNK